MRAVDDAYYAEEAALVDWTTRNNFRNSSGAGEGMVLKQMALRSQMDCTGGEDGATGRYCKERSKGTREQKEGRK